MTGAGQLRRLNERTPEYGWFLLLQALRLQPPWTAEELAHPRQALEKASRSTAHLQRLRGA